jgi:uncharacterized protein YbaP (TraB family)
VKHPLFTVLIALVALLGGCRKQAPPAPAPSAKPAAQAVVSAPATPEQPAPQWAQPFLFEVKTAGKHFFLLGTIHLPDARLDVFPPSLAAAFEESEVVATEIPLDDATQASMLPKLMLPEGQRLPAVVPPALYQKTSAAFADAGVPSAVIDGLKPWAVSLQLAMLDRMITMALKKPLDVVLYRRASKSGKAVDALETVDSGSCIN